MVRVFPLLIAVLLITALFTGMSNQAIQTNYQIEDITFSDDELPQNTVKPVSYPECGIPVLTYHSISTNPDNSLCVSEKQFREEMAWLYRHDYHALRLDEFYEALTQQGTLPDNPVVITFDDGYMDNYKVAWPILDEYGYTATFFIVTNYVSKYTIEWDQLKDLISHGNSIGSHSVSHRELSSLTDKQQAFELKESKQMLEDKLGISINAFCFPCGRYNDKTIELLTDCGYTLSFTTTSGKVQLGDDPFRLNRIRIWGGMSLSQFIGLVA